MRALITRNLGKKYEIYRRPLDRLVEFVSFGKKRLHEDFWALRGIDLEVAKGQTLGILGPNGAGKSTLLKLLAGTSFPSEGAIELNGRVTGLLELGAGFHPEFTGRENAIMSCSLLGMTRGEINKRIDEMREFAEIGDFFEQPVKTYSSGMYMRLGFAVASCLDPDILVVDEALSVGDEYFVKKCIERFSEFRANQKTIILVTHLIRNVRLICDRAFLLDHGHLIADGDPDKVSDMYLDLVASLTRRREGLAHPGAETAVDDVAKGGEIRMFDVKMVDRNGQKRDVFHSGEPVEFRASYEVNSAVKRGLFGIHIYRENGTLVLEHCPDIEKLIDPSWDKLKDFIPLRQPKAKGDRGEISCRFASLPFLGGTYYFNLWAVDVADVHIHTLGATPKAYFTVVECRSEVLGQFYVPGQWEDKPLR
jgi:ABC-type polysaccharide/polyol phosphate transport system ATPase subunit